mmetsp:Transcript_30646/g.39521  ORF Transcript_30646/g.39521 Transcript_30646/m.39521 type:complete len:111 (-) Transcript_30646:157-489(-)
MMTKKAKTKRKKKKRGRDDDEDESKTDKPKVKGKKAKTQAEPGSKYKSTKAGGDVRRKGEKLEPYAYIPLDAKMLSKKKSKSAKEKYRSVVEQGRNKSLKGLRRKKGGRK